MNFLQGSLRMTRAQHRLSSWRQPVPWGISSALLTPTLRPSFRARTLTQSKKPFVENIIIEMQIIYLPHTWSCCWPLPVLVCRGIILFRPPHLKTKFEDQSVKYSEEKYTSNKIKKFIQDNMWVSSQFTTSSWWHKKNSTKLGSGENL